MAQRLKSTINISASQRGFTDVDGTVANTTIIQHYIRNRIEHHKPYNILALDLQKAFDKVEQSSVLRGLGIDTHKINYVRGTLKDATSFIKVGNGKTRQIGIQRGVKQGDTQTQSHPL